MQSALQVAKLSLGKETQQQIIVNQHKIRDIKKATREERMVIAGVALCIAVDELLPLGPACMIATVLRFVSQCRSLSNPSGYTSWEMESRGCSALLLSIV